jgi:hypothetical protein
MNKNRVRKLEKQIKPEAEKEIIRVSYEDHTDQEWAELEAAGKVLSVTVETDPNFTNLFKGKR